MNQVQTTHAETEGGLATSASLLSDRMDQSIGEASSVMGALLTELLRRTLRGGVAKVGEQIDDYVAAKVDGTLTDRLPAVEQAAGAAADRAARVAADEVAQRQCSALAERTEEAARGLAARIADAARAAEGRAEEVQRGLGARIADAARAAEGRAEEVQRSLGARIDEEARAAQGQAEEVRRRLAAEIEEQARQAHATAGKVEQELGARLEEAARAARSETAEVGQKLTGKIVEVEKKAEAETATAARELSTQIEVAAKKAEETALGEINRQVDDLLDKSRKSTAAVKERIKVLEQQLEQARAGLLASVEGLRRENEALAARVTELERPRGLRALFLRLFGRGKKAG